MAKQDKNEQIHESITSNINLERTAFLITDKCTLKCKLCNTFIPYRENPQHYSLDYIKRITENYFKMVKHVGILSLAGGEPSMHPKLLDIFKHFFLYKKQFNEVHMTTNNTIKLSDELLMFFENNKKQIKIILDDYGSKLSPNFQYNKNQIEVRNINHRIITYYGDEACYGGWIDFSDHSKKCETIEERNAIAEKCFNRINKRIMLDKGELHFCPRSVYRTSQNIIPKVKGEYVDILDNTQSVEEKRKDLINMLNLPSVTSCGRCVGLTNEAPRQPPAEQLP